MNVAAPIRACLAALSLLVLAAIPALAEVSVTDLTGRRVTLPRPAQRIVLGEARHLSVLGLILDDPAARVVGSRQDKGLDQPTLDAWRVKFPRVDQFASVGTGNRDISAEAVIGLKPDLLILSLIDRGDPVIDRAAEQIEAVGIPVVYVDFFSHPLENSMPSLAILGTLTGAKDRAAAFAQFYELKLDRITRTLAEAGDTTPRPSVFFHVHAAPSGCCSTVGHGVFDDFIRTAGGRNIAADSVPGVVGNVSLEYLIDANPDFYVATGGQHMAARGGLVLGTGVDAASAKTSFDTLIAAPGLSSLRAVRDGQAAGVWHLFNDNPAHIALIEYLAKLFHPDLFADLDPDATLAEIDTRFSPVTVPGTWWTRP